MGKPGDTTNSNVSPLDSLGGNHTFLFFFRPLLVVAMLSPFFHPAKKVAFAFFQHFHNSHILLLVLLSVGVVEYQLFNFHSRPRIVGFEMR